MEETVTIEEKILSAARKVFITKGFEATKMHDVAEYAGINKDLLNYYYRNKQCLFDSVFEKAFITYLPDVFEILASSISFKDKISRIVDGYFKIIYENPHFADFFFNEVKRNPERLAINLKNKGLDISRVDDALREEAEKGNIKYIKAEHLICNLLSLVMMPFIVGPLIKSLLFTSNTEAYSNFIEERKTIIKNIIVDSLLVKED